MSDAVPNEKSAPRRPRFIGVRIAVVVLLVLLWIQALLDWRHLGYTWTAVGTSPIPGVTVTTLEPRTPIGAAMEAVTAGRQILWERPADPDDPILLLRAPGVPRGVRLVRTEAMGSDGGFLTIGVGRERDGVWEWLEGEAARELLRPTHQDFAPPSLDPNE